MDELAPIGRRAVQVDFEADRYANDKLALAYKLLAASNYESFTPQSTVQNRERGSSVTPCQKEVLQR